MNKYQYDDEYFIAVESDNVFLDFLDYEEEEAFARTLTYGRRQSKSFCFRRI